MHSSMNAVKDGRYFVLCIIVVVLVVVALCGGAGPRYGEAGQGRGGLVGARPQGFVGLCSGPVLRGAVYLGAAFGGLGLEAPSISTPTASCAARSLRKRHCQRWSFVLRAGRVGVLAAAD